MEIETPSGLVVKVDDRRALTRVKPRDSEPNGNPEIGSVGPDVPEGFGDTHVMFPQQSPPIEAQAWNGWPVGWNTPLWNSGSPMDQLVARVSTAWSCLDLNASVLASMPAYLTQGTVPQEPLPFLTNPQPEVYTDWTEFAKQLFLFYQLGEAFVWATSRYANGFPRTFVCLRSDWVNAEMIDGFRRYSLGGVDITDDVLHIRYASWPGDARGHGPLEAVAYNLLGAAALEQYATDLATRGGIPWAVLTHPDELSAKQVTDLQNRWIQARMRAMGAPAILSGGITLQPLTLSPRDMALLDLLQFNEARIAVCLGVPPFLVGLPSSGDSLTYSTVAQLFDYHWRSGLRPKAQAVMGALSGWLLPAGTSIELNRDEYTRPALGERVAAYQGLFNIQDPITGERAITVEEIRALERFAPVTGAAALSGGQG